MSFEEICQKLGRRFKKNVYYYDGNNQRIDVNIESIERVKIFFNASIIGTLMKGAELELKEKIETPNEIFIEIKASYDQSSVTKIYGAYYIYETTYNADTKTYTYKCYDKMLKTMVDYEPIDISYPCTIQEYFDKLTDEFNFVTNVELVNGEKIMNSDIYAGINYTYRSVLQDIAEANGILLYVDDNELKIAEFDDDNVAYINDDILKNTNIGFGEHYGAINTLVLSRAGGSDNIYYPEILPENPIEFKISDNQMLNGNDRARYMPNIYANLVGKEYDIYDTELVGFGGFKPLQKVVFNTGGNEYSSYVFNNEMEWTNGFIETIYTDPPEESVTEYNYADTNDERINRAYIIVDKQNQRIDQLAEKVVPVSNTITGNNSVTLENAHEGLLYNLEFYGDISLHFPSDGFVYGYPLMIGDDFNISDNTIISSAVPRDSLPKYPSEELYPKDTYLLVDENKYKLDFDFLNYINESVHDTFIYQNGECWIERNVGVDEYGNMYKLPKTIIEKRKNIQINVKADSIIKLESFDNAKYKTTYLLQNEYTDTFATEVYVKSEIQVTADGINQEVSKKVGEDEFKSAISQTSEQISSKVSKGEVVSEINQSAEQVTITGNRLVVQADNFQLDGSGNMICTNAKVTGEINSTSGNIGGWTITTDRFTNGFIFIRSDGWSNVYTFADMVIIQNYLLGTITLDGTYITHYDLNGDGMVTAYELAYFQQIFLGKN